MYNHDKQINKNTKLHTHRARGARLTPMQNRCNKRNIKITLSNAILNSNNNNDKDSNNNKIGNNNSNNNNSNNSIIIMINNDI